MRFAFLPVNVRAEKERKGKEINDGVNALPNVFSRQRQTPASFLNYALTTHLAPTCFFLGTHFLLKCNVQNRGNNFSPKARLKALKYRSLTKQAREAQSESTCSTK